MSAQNFVHAMPKLFGHEGGFANHRNDPGGATNMGVTHITLADYRGVDSVTVAQVKALTRHEAQAIYKSNYWDRVRGDDLPGGLDYAVFDFAVNSGVGRAVRMLQQELKSRGLYGGKIDGIIGSKSLNALRQVNDIDGLIDAYQDRRLAFLKRLKGWATFGNGWTRRVREVREFAKVLASNVPLIPAVPVRPTEISDCRTPHDVPGACEVKTTSVVTSTTEGKAVAGTGIGTMGVAASEAAGQLAPLAEISQTVKVIFIMLTIASVGLGIYATWRKLNDRAGDEVIA
jgi:lysozyme family protein